MLALLCAMVQTSWAQANWEEVYAMTNTTEANWTALPEGTTAGATIGMAGATTYYYADANLSFTNSTVGGSGLTILGNVYLYLPHGVTVTCTGANASGQTGAGAGIELTEGNSLCLLGKGAVNATGGNAANGGNGANGHNASYSSSEGAAWVGGGGTGGNGGGGAGAGIGTRGGTGGAGGSAPESEIYYKTWVENGVAGSAGGAGLTADAMGNLYVSDGITVNVTGGSRGAAGTAGSAGKSYLYVGYYVYSFPGGGGGGAGGFGGAASGIGTGGPGGGGGGGGAKGSHTWAAYGFFQVFANGGGGGQNADGSFAADGGTAGVTKANVENGLCYTNDADWVKTASERTGGDVTTTTNGGSGGALGAASTSESAITMTVKLPSQSEWDLVCLQTNTSQNQWRALLPGGRKGATIGAAGTTTYYFATGDRTFTNSNAGGSGLTILGTVYLFIPTSNQITCTGTHASGTTGAGAGIELTAGNTLYLIGGGKLVATGGNAANGAGGTDGGDASYSTEYAGWVRSGDGGRGGDGGGGAGAGIGTSGGNGGDGGAGSAGIEEHLGNSQAGHAGSNGANGGTAADMGTLYIYQLPCPQTEIHGGSGGASGNGGKGGLHVLLYHDYEDEPDTHGAPGHVTREIWSGGGGGGGAGGGFGGTASNIGTGGPGGGGGGGGASGTIAMFKPDYGFYQVGAFGGNSGANADGTLAGAGASTLLDKDDESLLAGKYLIYSTKSCQGWENGDNRAAGGNGGTAGNASTAGTYSVVPATIILADDGDNSTAIGDANGYLADVTLQGRTLYKDGAWNTLCLPFNVTLAGSPLEGAVARPLTEGGISGTTLNLTFGEAVTELVAGTPYIIKWYGGDNLVSPVFSGVTIDATMHPYDSGEAEGDQRVRFTGTYSSMEFGETDNSILLMGGENMLYYPTTGAGLGAQHAYFKIGGDGAKARRITGFSIDFGDGEATGIISAEANSCVPSVASDQRSSASLFTIHSSLSDWYTLDGRRLSGKPTRSGIYINGGRKVVIK